MIQPPGSRIAHYSGRSKHPESGHTSRLQPQFSAQSSRKGSEGNGFLSTLKNGLHTLVRWGMHLLSAIGLIGLLRYLTGSTNKPNESELAKHPLLHPNPAMMTFQQNYYNTCYMLSGLDALMHHPKGHNVLRQIKIVETPNKKAYTVKFPGQPEPIRVDKHELRDESAVSSPYLGITLIEKAYLKIPGVEVGAFDQSTVALERIFGWRQQHGESISSHNQVGSEQFIGGNQFTFDERNAQWKRYFRQQTQHPDETNVVDILTAIRVDNGLHYYSIRLDQSTPDTITTADPFDTETSVTRWPIDEFLDTFHIEGIRLPIPQHELKR